MLNGLLGPTRKEVPIFRSLRRPTGSRSGTKPGRLGRYDLVAFDFDGTLADTVAWLEGIVNGVAERYGFRRVDAAGRAFLRQCDAWEAIRYLRIPLWKTPFIARHIRARMAEAVPDIALFDGIDHALAACHEAGIHLAVVSSNSLSNVRCGLGESNTALIRHFECGTHLLGKSARLKRLLRLVEVAPERAILIGDEARDIAAAKAVGMRAGAVAWGYQPIESLIPSRPDEIFLQIADLAPRLTTP